MRPVRISLTAAGVTDPVITDHYRSPYNVSVGVTLSGSATYSVEYTYDDVFSSAFNPVTAQWFVMTAFPAGTATSKDGQISSPVMAIRLNAATLTGTLSLTVLQAGMPGG